MDEFRAVYGRNEPLAGQGDPDDLGNGGCNEIRRDTGGVIGRWSSWGMASRALNRLQQLGGRFEYRLEESHHWVEALGDSATCSRCRVTRQLPGASATLTAPYNGW
ncbi:hypothetical protein QFZ35_003836 [Arthrobacter ulcerisalmonis]|nr:hypothetical protein [Arthrobacter ulcerisalmonis]MDQ0665338.1 hypothetical protein [Arthrobacter ulcerisalmonis]